MSARSLQLKQRLARGETTYGAWLSLSNANVAEIMAGERRAQTNEAEVDAMCVECFKLLGARHVEEV